MLTMDRVYPTDFSVPKRLLEFIHMREYQLKRLMMAYQLEVFASRAFRFGEINPAGDNFEYSNSTVRRHGILIVLFQFLGAYQLAEYLRYREQEEDELSVLLRGREHSRLEWYPQPRVLWYDAHS